MKKISFCAVSLLAAFTVSSAIAAESSPHRPAAHPMFEKADANSDGGISKDEWRAKGDSMFTEIDGDKDGKLTKDEMKAHHEAKRAERKQRREARAAKAAAGEKPAAPAPTANK